MLSEKHQGVSVQTIVYVTEENRVYRIDLEIIGWRVVALLIIICGMYAFYRKGLVKRAREAAVYEMTERFNLGVDPATVVCSEPDSDGLVPCVGFAGDKEFHYRCTRWSCLSVPAVKAKLPDLYNR